MYRIIGKKRYNTKTAELKATWENGYNGRDFKYEQESLYRKKNGEFFLFGWGGPMSNYAQYYGNETSGGARLTPLTDDEAREWCADRLTGEEYDEIFPDDDLSE